MAITKRGDKPPLPERLQVPREAGDPYSHSERLPPVLGTGKAEAGGPYSRSGCLPPELGTEEAEAGGRSWRSTQPFGTSPSRAGDREGPVSAHPLLGPRKWSPGRAGSKAEGTYPVSCRPGGWSAAWVRGATAAVELEGASTASAGSPHLEPHVGRQM